MTSLSGFTNQEAELVAVKDGKQYILSHKREAQIDGPGEREGDELVAYIIQHADIIRDYEAFDYSNCTLKVTKTEQPRNL